MAAAQRSRARRRISIIIGMISSVSISVVFISINSTTLVVSIIAVLIIIRRAPAALLAAAAAAAAVGCRGPPAPNPASQSSLRVITHREVVRGCVCFRELNSYDLILSDAGTPLLGTPFPSSLSPLASFAARCARPSVCFCFSQASTLFCHDFGTFSCLCVSDISFFCEAGFSGRSYFIEARFLSLQSSPAPHKSCYSPFMEKAEIFPSPGNSPPSL